VAESPPWKTLNRPSRLAPGFGSLVEAEMPSSVRWLIRLRWLAGLGVICITLAIEPIFGLQLAVIPLLSIGFGILLYNLVFYLVERRLERNNAPPDSYLNLAVFQVAMDWVAMVLLIHFSGGIESPVIFFFIFHIAIASIFFSRPMAFEAAILAVILLTFIALTEYIGILPHVKIMGLLDFPLYRNRLYVAAVLAFFSCTGLIVTYLVTTISEHLRRREEEVVQLTEGLRRATAWMQALNEGAQALNSTLELPQVLNRLVENTAKVMGVRACSIRMLDKSGNHLVPLAVYGLSQAYLEKGPVELDKNPLAREVLDGKIVNVPDVSTSSLLQYPEKTVLEGISSSLSAPLFGKNGPLGVLRAYSDEKNHFTPEDEAFLAATAAQGSIAIDNAIAYQEIEDLDAAKTAFMRTFTHELRSPVSVTRSLLQTLNAGYVGDVTPQQRDLLERAIRRVDYLQKLIDDLLDLAAGKVYEKMQQLDEPVALEEVVERVVNRFEVLASEKALTLEWLDEVAGCPKMVLATPEGLDRVFNNLISNAVKYTRPNGKVTVTLSCSGKQVKVAVEDTGIGIPEDAIERLFEEFYRAPNAKEMEREGTGLGLAIVKDTVTRFGGRVTVRSEVGLGTRFVVYLPLIEELPLNLDDIPQAQAPASPL